MYWAWVKIGVPSTVKMTPNRRIVFQEYFSPYPGLLGQPKVIRRSPSWDYIFPPSNLSPVFLHCMIKAPKLRGHLSLLVEAWRYVQRTIIGHSTWISRLNDYIVTYWDMTICVNVNFDTGIFRYVRVFNASHVKPCVCVSLPADGLAPAEFLHACGCASDEPQRHVLQPRGLSEQPEPVGRHCLSEWRCHAVSSSGFPAQKRSVCRAPTEAPQHRQCRLVLFPQKWGRYSSVMGFWNCNGVYIKRCVFCLIALLWKFNTDVVFLCLTLGDL